MESTRSRAAMISKVLRIVYIGVLLFHLLLWALNVRAQTFERVPRGSNPLGCTNLPQGNGLFNSHFCKGFEALDLRRRLVRGIYTSQIGVREKQPNSGPEVEKYLRYVNLPKGNPWCAAFVCWVYGEAGVGNPRSGWSPDLFPGSRTIFQRVENGKLKVENGWAESMTQKFQGNRSIIPSSLATGNRQRATDPRRLRIPDSTPKTGDVFGLYFPEKRRIAHVGFVDEWQDPWVTTVEGNTNVLGSREGDGVYRKRRLVRSIYKVARYIN